MPPPIAAVVFIVGIVALVIYDTERGARVSRAVWLPVVWLSLAASRMVSQWLDLRPPIDSPDQYLEGSPLDRNVLTGLIAIGLIVLIGRRQKVAAVFRANWPVVLFFVYCLVSVSWSDYPDIAFKRWVKALGDLVMLLIVLTDRDRLVAIKQFLARVGFLLVVLSILFIRYYPDLGRTYGRWEGTLFYTGVGSDKNMLGMICLVSGLAALWRVLEIFKGGKVSLRNKALVAQSVLLGMVLWLLSKANSITALSCFLLGGGVMVVMSYPKMARKRGAAHILVFLALFAAVSPLFLNLGGGVLQTMGRDSTLTGRTALWTQLLRINQNALVGSGFDSFWLGKRVDELQAALGWRPNEAHNGYLELYLNVGWVGLVLFGVILTRGYATVIRALRGDPGYGGLRLAYFVAVVAYGFTEAAFRTMNPVWIAFLLATLEVPQTKESKAPVARATGVQSVVARHEVAEVQYQGLAR